jgi:hypothetical protein
VTGDGGIDSGIDDMLWVGVVSVLVLELVFFLMFIFFFLNFNCCCFCCKYLLGMVLALLRGPCDLCHVVTFFIK